MNLLKHIYLHICLVPVPSWEPYVQVYELKHETPYYPDCIDLLQWAVYAPRTKGRHRPRAIERLLSQE